MDKAHTKNESEWTEEIPGKSNGIDKIPNFSLRALPKGHSKIASLLSDIIKITGKAPKWLPKGVPYLSY